MYLKRFSLALVICFALLSLFAPRFGPIKIVEVTALLVSHPWERLLSLLFPKGSPDDLASMTQGPWDRSRSSQLWWEPVFSSTRPAGGDLLIGGRVVPALSRAVTRINVDMGSDPPVRPGDPVVCGEVFVGFVSSIAVTGLVEVSLLGDRESRSVAAEVGDVVAGEKIYFPIGGECDVDGNLPIKFPSTRFGLASGSDVVTSPEHPNAYARSPIPAGLVLGRVSVNRSTRRTLAAQPVVLPAFRVTDLRRIAVLVPADRLEAQGRAPIPELQLYTIPVKTFLPPGFLREWSFLRLFSGLERGLDEGDFVVAGDHLAGRIAATGLLSSRADIFLLPGKTTVIARLRSSGTERNRLRVHHRSRGFCSVEADRALSGLKEGCPLYFPDDPCGGTEFYPLCHVVDPGDGVTFTVRCADLSGDDSSFCLGFRR